jgi:hypothetical protein
LCLIECVNNPYPLAFLTKEPEVPFAHVYDIFVSGLPAHVRRKGGKSIAWSRWSRIAEYLHMEEYHHYCTGRIATQYCSFAPKKGTKPVEWMAWHEEGHFESFGKLCAAINHDIEQHFTKTVPLLTDRGVNLEIHYRSWSSVVSFWTCGTVKMQWRSKLSTTFTMSSRGSAARLRSATTLTW